MPSKVRSSVAAALSGLGDGAVIAVGGFGLSGNPEALIAGVRDLGIRHLTLVSNNAGSIGLNLATWLQDGLVDRFIGTYVGDNADLQAAIDDGRVEVQLIPQGTFAERLRAAGAGLAGFYTPTGVGTIVAEGKEVRNFAGRHFLLEEALPVDVALIRAHRADPFGNVRFWRTSRNFSESMAMAATRTIVEADGIVALGDLDPDDVHLPGVFVQDVVEVPHHEDVIEHRTVRQRP
mgnify:CR=1 FL=1